MDTEMLIEEIRKLPLDQKRVVRAFVLADIPEEQEGAKDPRTLREILSQSPFAKMEFELPKPEYSPVRPVEL